MDRIAERLTTLGYTLTNKTLRDDRVSGVSFFVDDFEIVYRIDKDDETVMLCLIRREGGFKGIRSSFAKMIWFVGFLADNREQLKVRRVKGLVRADNKGTESALPSSRIMQFYKRLFEVYSEGVGLSGKWICLELKDFRYPGRYRSKITSPEAQ